MTEHSVPSTGRHRGFGHGGLRLVLLKLIAEQPRHGYELIKAIEALTAGHYRPSAGMVYPLLNQLREQGLIAQASTTGAVDSAAESKKQPYAITPAGQHMLEREAQRILHIFERVEQRARQPVQVTRAIENFKFAVKQKLSDTILTPAQAAQLAAILDETIQRIEQL